MEFTAELYEAIVKVVDDRVKDIRVTREEFERLREMVERLAINVHELTLAQKQTDKTVAELVESQKQINKTVAELAESQKQINKTVAELVESQKQINKTVAELAEAQRQINKTVAELAEAQKETQLELNRLTKSHGDLRKEVFALSENIGYGLEDIARVVLPGYLYRHFKIDIYYDFESKFFKVNGKEIEINLYAEGVIEKEEVIILGESKSRIYEKEIKKFVENAKKVDKLLKKKTFKLMFGYLVHPSATEFAKRHSVKLIASYQK